METHYTPTLDDFFYGLEYEYKSPLESVWTKHTFDEHEAPNILLNVKERPTCFRIKILDKDDIESLGFIFREDDRFPNWIRFVSKSNAYTIKAEKSVDLGRPYMSIWIYKEVSFHIRPAITIKTGDSPDPSTGTNFFFGNCMNKSKLIQTLKDCRISEATTGV